MAVMNIEILTSAETSPGFARYDVTFAETEPGDLLIVSVKDANTGDFKSVVDGSPKRISLHTHLLPDGPHEVHFRLMRKAAFFRKTQLAEASVELILPDRGGLYHEVRDVMRKSRTPLIFEGHCDSSYYPYDDASLTPWFDGPDAERHIEQLVSSGQATPQEGQHLREFVRDGFVILEGAIDDELVAAVNRDIDDAIAKGYQGYEFGSSQRIEHLHMHYDAVRKLWLDARHRRLVDLIFNAPARPCQTLTYVFGSQQDDHTDLVHLTPFPAGLMAGTWISLQDIVPNSGELVVYKGSHRAKRMYMKTSGCAKVTTGNWTEFIQKVIPFWADLSKQYEKIVYRPKKGTVLIWHENLLHGGSVRKDQSLERRSIVIHSFADGAVVYYDSTGMHGYAAAESNLKAA